MAAHTQDDATLTMAEAQEHFIEVVDRAARGKERVVVTRRGKPVVAVVPAEDARLLEELEDRLDLEEARAALEEWKRSGKDSVPMSAILKEFGIDR
ncbi:MAG TPA: type II toxin-antitoxin system Phd/YefM family antitoxin [Dongiaceae bacterium]|nr:type II toxin-antitoxin system Phd/YefM family antitoxin [Dongiaceae bacterium]